MKSLADCKLYTFVDTIYLHSRTPEAAAQQKLVAAQIPQPRARVDDLGHITLSRLPDR